MAGHGAKVNFSRGDQVEGMELTEALVTSVFGSIPDPEAVNAMREALKIWLMIQYQAKSLVPWADAAAYVEQNTTDVH